MLKIILDLMNDYWNRMRSNVANLTSDHVQILLWSEIIFKAERVNLGLTVLFAINFYYLVKEFFLIADLPQIVGGELR